MANDKFYKAKAGVSSCQPFLNVRNGNGVTGVDLCRLGLPTLISNRDGRYFVPVDEFDVSEVVQQNEMSSANQRVIPALDWPDGTIIGRDRKWHKRIRLQKLLYLISHRHTSKR